MCSQIFFWVNDLVLYAVFDRGREQETLVLSDGVRKSARDLFSKSGVFSATVALFNTALEQSSIAKKKPASQISEHVLNLNYDF